MSHAPSVWNICDFVLCWQWFVCLVGRSAWREMWEEPVESIRVLRRLVSELREEGEEESTEGVSVCLCVC